MRKPIIIRSKKIIISASRSYVAPKVKLKGDTGKGEGKLYVGTTNISKKLDKFFNNFSPKNTYKIDKQSVINFINNHKADFQDTSKYRDVSQDYPNEKPNYWSNLADSSLKFNIVNYVDSQKRYYLRENPKNISKEKIFMDKFREILLPNIANIVIEKRQNAFTFKVQDDTKIINLSLSKKTCIEEDNKSEVDNDESIHTVKNEGKPKYYLGKKYERNSNLRKKAIDIHGTICTACKFDFFHTYGEVGKDYIEIHHKTPLSNTGKIEVNAATDLAPLCSNCHRMVHRSKAKVLTMEELEELISQNIINK